MPEKEEEVMVSTCASFTKEDPPNAKEETAMYATMIPLLPYDKLYQYAPDGPPILE